jgi:beta-1,2-mannobiose phosphorylase / 1,2-beta-oligomannan phosphorylase
VKTSQPYITKLLNTLQSKFDWRKNTLRGLGVYLNHETVYFYFQSRTSHHNTFEIARSKDGFNFELYRKHVGITKYFAEKETIDACSDFQVTKLKKTYLLTYKKKTGQVSQLCSATSTNLLHFEQQEKNTNDLQEHGLPVPHYTCNGQYVMYIGESSIKLAFSNDLTKWNIQKNMLLEPRADHFDYGPLEVEHVATTEKGILVMYHSRTAVDNRIVYRVGAALFDTKDPSKLLWRSNKPVWQQTDMWHGKNVYPIGVINLKGNLISYWGVEGEGLFAVTYSYHKLGQGIRTRNVSLDLDRVPHNPILSPKQENSWEAFNTFNPAAIYEDGKVHLIYRAQGYDYVSVLGYATSNDGYHIHERFDEPIYLPTEPFEFTGPNKPKHISHFYVSGGGYGGCEDPRITRIDDRMYMTYVAYNGWSPPRVALTSISVDDFLNRRWLWEKPVLISPPGVVDKNAVIFPEKVNGKYVIMHRIYPDILIDYVDDLNFDGTTFLKNEFKISPRPTMWDSRKIGAGAPPIKTKDGWLLIYQSVGNQEPGRYKIGAMLLDLNDPTKVLHRSNAPILAPDMKYENEGFKAGVVYPCGAVVIQGTLFVYYGGADSYICVATANLDHFLAELKYSELAKVEPAVIRKVMHN